MLQSFVDQLCLSTTILQCSPAHVAISLFHKVVNLAAFFLMINRGFQCFHDTVTSDPVESSKQTFFEHIFKDIYQNQGSS